MKRRSFLKLLGGSALAASLPLPEPDVVTSTISIDPEAISPFNWEALGEMLADDTVKRMQRSGFMQTLMRNHMVDELVPPPRVTSRSQHVQAVVTTMVDSETTRLRMMQIVSRENWKPVVTDYIDTGVSLKSKDEIYDRVDTIIARFPDVSARQL